jgi:hypothetical protein
MGGLFVQHGLHIYLSRRLILSEEAVFVADLTWVSL